MDGAFVFYVNHPNNKATIIIHVYLSMLHRLKSSFVVTRVLYKEANECCLVKVPNPLGSGISRSNSKSQLRDHALIHLRTRRCRYGRVYQIRYFLAYLRDLTCT